MAKNGSLVDSSEEHQGKEYFGNEKRGIQITAGAGEVIQGWDMALLSMSLGEIADITISPKYAFGEEGRPPKIPPKSWVIFRVEVL